MITHPTNSQDICKYPSLVFIKDISYDLIRHNYRWDYNTHILSRMPSSTCRHGEVSPTCLSQDIFVKDGSQCNTHHTIPSIELHPWFDYASLEICRYVGNPTRIKPHPESTPFTHDRIFGSKNWCFHWEKNHIQPHLPWAATKLEQSLLLFLSNCGGSSVWCFTDQPCCVYECLTQLRWRVHDAFKAKRWSTS